MSRAHNARRKAERRKVLAESESTGDSSRRARFGHLIPAAVIVAIFVVVGVMGFGGGGGKAGDRKHGPRYVTALLSGIPQQGPTLGSPDAPITLWVFADLECPTVQQFATAYLPSIIETWVRGGKAKLRYRSLRTDTDHERTFFQQESAAMAAGRQGKLWNYALTFIYEQGTAHTNYADPPFLTRIAAQVPGLRSGRWQHDRVDASLSTQVALDLHYARNGDLEFTPSFLIGLSESGSDEKRSPLLMSATEELKSSLTSIADTLSEESVGDVPSLGEILAN